jgi:hypothetical protein
VAAALAFALAAPAPAVWAQSGQQRSAWADGGLGVASVFISLFWGTAKLGYAGAGALVGVLSYAVTGGRRDVLETIINPSLRGDYLITPQHLTRERPWVFFGPYPEDIQQAEETVMPEQRYPTENRF